MDIRLVSEDRELLKMCREIVTSFPQQPGSFLAAASYDSNDDGADLCIWDFESDTTHLPDPDADPSKHLFLVHRSDLPAFRDRMTAAEVRILLKPVTRATLEVFLAQALAAHQDRETPASFVARGSR